MEIDIKETPGDIIFDILKYIGAGIVSIVSLFLLWVCGRYKNQLDELWDKHKISKSEEAEKLRDMQEQEFNKMKADISEIKHDFAQFKNQIGTILNKIENTFKKEDRILELEERILLIVNKLDK